MSEEINWKPVTEEEIPKPEFGEQRWFQTESFHLTQEGVGRQMVFLSEVISNLCNDGAKRFDMQIEAVGNDQFVICVTAERNPL